MPTDYVIKMAKKKKMDVSESERLWHKAKAIASHNGHDGEYEYITGIYKKMMGESMTFKEFLLIAEESPTSTSGSVMSSHSATDGKPDEHVILKRKRKKKSKSLGKENINKE